MKIIYKNKSVQKQFDKKYQGKWRYPPQVKILLVAMQNFISNAVSLKDIFAFKPYQFHKLTGDREGEWSLYVKNTGYRVTVIPCDDENKEILNGDILTQCMSIKIVKVTEVSNHYE